MKEILYILLDQYADHEIPFLTQGITTDEIGPRKEMKYVNKILENDTPEMIDRFHMFYQLGMVELFNRYCSE